MKIMFRVPRKSGFALPYVKEHWYKLLKLSTLQGLKSILHISLFRVSRKIMFRVPGKSSFTLPYVNKHRSRILSVSALQGRKSILHRPILEYKEDHVSSVTESDFMLP